MPPEKKYLVNSVGTQTRNGLNKGSKLNWFQIKGIMPCSAAVILAANFFGFSIKEISTASENGIQRRRIEKSEGWHECQKKNC